MGMERGIIHLCTCWCHFTSLHDTYISATFISLLMVPAVLVAIIVTAEEPGILILSMWSPVNVQHIHTDHVW